MLRTLPILMAAACLAQAAYASGLEETSPQHKGADPKPAAPQGGQAQDPVRQPAVPPLNLPVQQGGPIPPRDPRLPAPKVQDTSVLPNVTVPLPPAGVITGDVSARPITADDAARIALRLQPNIDIARAGITIQKGRTRQVKAGLQPQVTVLGGYTHVQNITRPGDGGGAVRNNTGTGSGSSGTGTGGTGSGGAGSGNSGAGGSGSGGTGAGSGGSGGTGTGGNGSGNSGTGSTGSGGSGSSGSGSGSPTTTTVGGGSPVTQGVLMQATLRQLIYDFNHTLSQVRQNVELEKAAAQNLTRVQSDSVLEVKQAFYQYVQNLRQVQVSEQDVANRQAQLDLAQARYNVGLGVQTDIIAAQTAKAEAILNLSQAQVNAEQGHINLATLMGIDPRTPLVPAEGAEPPALNNDVNALTQVALTQRPEVVQAQYTLRSAQYGVTAARTNNSPAISGSASVISNGDMFLPQQNNLTIGINLTWTPFDGGLTRGLVEEARGNVTVAQKQLYIAQQNAKNDVATAYVNVRAAEQRVAVAQASVANAEEGVRIATGRYSTGLGLFLDIINAQAFLVTARTNLVSTLSAVDQYRVALAHSIGAVLPRGR